MAILIQQQYTAIKCKKCGKVIGGFNPNFIQHGGFVTVSPHWCTGGKGLCRTLKEKIDRLWTKS